MTDALARLDAALADRYHIERELGAGGMATVYLEQLDRDPEPDPGLGRHGLSPREVG